MAVTKHIVYVDMDDVLCAFSKAYQEARTKCPEVTYPQSQYGFYADLMPIDGAIEGMKKLNSQDEIDLYILTAPSVLNPNSYTEKRVWVEKHLGMEFVHRLIISPNKGLLKGDVLIDDRLKGHGQEGFEGRLLQFGSKALPNWNQVLRKLMELKHGG